MSDQEHGTREATLEAPAPAETTAPVEASDQAPAEAPSQEAADLGSADAAAEAMASKPQAKPDDAAAKEAPDSDEAQPKYRRGQVYRGTICETSPTAVLVDLGEGDIGVVPGRELELMTKRLLESLALGAEVDVYVVNPRNHRGKMVLSINHAMEEMDWRNAEKFAESKAVYEALIGGYNKGGLIVRFGRLRGFVPQSQLSESRVRQISGGTPEERYGPMVNQPIGVKVMEVDRHRNRLILSERAATREVRVKRKESLIAELTVGEIRKGKVVSLENFGAFVDIGGGEGLVHVSELAWGHITHPRQVLSLGEEIEVEVISVNPEANRIGLSRRRVLGDPWDEIATALRRGQLARATVTKLTKFGAFARLNDYEAVEGLIHISELAKERVEHPREVVKRGQAVVLRIIKIDIKERRLGLSLKSVNSTEYLDLDWEMAIQESVALPASEEATEDSE
ncbi:MAG: S1 RNA-binding domain-containing protein [Chloroflexi bacterium]|nr:S1 RNA-binding domain-containing protein [Chloroflexota bacterium]MCY4247560.1 S1 RNA-binding domain-containing protein [Chloroflexota bacterium]